MPELNLNQEQVAELAKIAGIDDVSSLLPQDEGADIDQTEIYSSIKVAFANRFQELQKKHSEALKKAREDAKRAGWRDRSVSLEATLQQIGISDFENTEQALLQFAERLKAASASSGKNVSEDELVNNPVFKQALGREVEKHTSKYKQEAEEAIKKAQLVEQQFVNNEKRNLLRAYVNRLHTERNANLAKGGLETSLDAFIAVSGGLDMFELQDTAAGKKIQPLEKRNGELVPAQNEFAHELSIEEFLIQQWQQLFGFNAAPPGDSGASPTNAKTGRPAIGLEIKTLDDYRARMKAAKNDKEREEIRRAFAGI